MLEGVLFILLSCFYFLVSNLQRVNSIHASMLDSMESRQVGLVPKSVIFIKLVIHQSV
jgi:hypothetical protein